MKHYQVTLQSAYNYQWTYLVEAENIGEAIALAAQDWDCPDPIVSVISERLGW